jgi:serine/threonine protein kinase
MLLNSSSLKTPQRLSLLKPAYWKLLHPNINLIDFGLSVVETTPPTERPDELVGTVGFMAPEVALGLSWSYKVDSFSAGCVLYEMWKGQALFKYHSSEKRLDFKLVHHLAEIQYELGDISKEMKINITWVLSVNLID